MGEKKIFEKKIFLLIQIWLDQKAKVRMYTNSFKKEGIWMEYFEVENSKIQMM